MPGRQVGRYVVVALVGAGSMGTVYRAYDPRLRREVALKCIETGSGTASSLAAVVTEAHAMAALAHPNVVAVYDVEVASDRVFVAMEYVRGSTLADWLATKPRTVAEVVGAFVEAGRGLAALHRAGLVHRDFKAINVMVGDDGRIRLADFGLASFDASRRRSWTSPSEPGHGGSPERTVEERQRPTGGGTPAYMAPEQHEGIDVDGRADQYAFCVAAWKALTGRLPFESTGLRGIVQAKRAGPPRSMRADVPRRIVDALRRGLAFDRAHRWPSMNELLAALTHRPRSRGPWFATAGAVVLAGALLGRPVEADERCSSAHQHVEPIWNLRTAAAVDEALTATGVPHARRASDHARERLQAYADEWARVHEAACRAPLVQGSPGSTDLDLQMTCLGRARQSLTAVVEVLGTVDAAMVDKLADVLGGLPALERCEDVEALRADVPPPPPAALREAVDRVRRELAAVRVLVDGGRFEAAQQRLEPLTGSVDASSYPPLGTELALHRGRVARGLGLYGESERAFAEAIVLGLASKQWSEVREAMLGAGVVAGFHRSHPRAGLAYATLAMSLEDRPSRDPLYRSDAIELHALMLGARSEHARAEALLREVIELREAALGPDSPRVAWVHNNLALSLWAQGELEAAERALHRTVDIVDTTVGPEHPAAATVRGNWATLLTELGRLDAAQAEHRKVLAFQLARLGPDHPSIAVTRTNLGNVLALLQQPAEAEEHLSMAVALLERTLGHDSLQLASARTALGMAVRDAGRPREAIVQFDVALEAMRRQQGPAYAIENTRFQRALALFAEGSHREAFAEARAAHTALAAMPEPGPRQAEKIAAWLSTHAGER